jgi:dUTPase
MAKKKPAEQKEKKKGYVSSVLPKSPLKNYQPPLLHKVATEIVVDDLAFVPKYCNPDSAVVDLVANIPDDHTGQRRVALSHRSTVVIDCGFSVKLPYGYKAVIKANQELANHGLIMSAGPQVVDSGQKDRVTVTVTNVGKEIVVINHQDKVAQMWIEPVYLFDWVLGNPAVGENNG